jgi:hypothetical protein
MPKPWKRVSAPLTFPKDWKLVPVGDQYAVPEAFTAVATSDDARAEVAVVVAAGRAHARSVTLMREPEVTSTTLRSLPVRDVMAWGLLLHLYRMELREGGAKFTPVQDPSEDEIALIAKLVGYVNEESVRP